MDTNETGQKEPSSFTHIARIWREENYQLIVFVAVQVLIGQAGLVAVLLLAYQGSSSLDAVWDGYLRSGGSYTFAIALLSSACAAVACEVIEVLREKSVVLMLGRKIVWSLVAAMVIFFQALLVGPLLVSQMTTAADDRAAVEIHSPPTAGSNTAVIQKAPFRHDLQIIFWGASIVIAFQLFSLGRAKHLHDRYARKRSEDIQKLSTLAGSQTTTFDGEKI